jgi:hypothetical protein
MFENFLFDTVDVAGAISMCAPDVPLQGYSGLLILVIRADVFEQNASLNFLSYPFEVMDGNVGVFSNWSHQTSPCMCRTTLLSYTHILTYTLSKAYKTENFAGNENSFWFSHSEINSLLQNMAHLLATVVDGLRSELTNKTFTFHRF